MRCPADSSDSIHIAVIKPLKVESWGLLEHLNYPPELQFLAPLLSMDFVSVIDETQPNIAIPVEHISVKCFDISTAE